MISSQRLKEQLAHLQTLTTPEGKGINRLAFSDTDWQGRAYLMSLMREAGLFLRTDAFGNVIGHRAGKNEALPAIMCGSHGDSVPEGGNYDGIVGILAGIEVARSMQEDGFINDRPLEIVLFMCEESSRFNSATLGSKAMRGHLAEQDLRRLRDKKGNTLYDVLKERDLKPEQLASAFYTGPLTAFLEIHIEQGKVLEHEQLQLGVVTGIAAPTRLKIHFHGNADHSGATPMHLRHDGLCAAAETILAVERIASVPTPETSSVVGTVGVVEATPGALNVVPGEVTIGIDIRSISPEKKEAAAKAVREQTEKICRQRNIPYTIEELNDDPPVKLDPRMVEFLSQCCREQGKRYKQMPSGAGHDAMHWAGYTPTGMLFLPCKNGISHNPAESATLEDITGATQVLDQAIRKLCGREELL